MDTSFLEDTAQGVGCHAAPEAQNMTDCSRHLLPVTDTMELLAGKWKFLILLGLMFGGKTRFKQLQRNIAGITGKMLSKDLKELELHGIVARTVHDTAPITVAYELTPYGHSLQPLLNELHAWGTRHRERMMGKDESAAA